MLKRDVTNIMETGLPLACYNMIKDFAPPMIYGIPMVKENLYPTFSKLSPLFYTSNNDKLVPSTFEFYADRPKRWKYISLTTFFRHIEAVKINQKDSVDDSFRYSYLLI